MDFVEELQVHLSGLCKRGFKVLLYSRIWYNFIFNLLNFKCPYETIKITVFNYFYWFDSNVKLLDQKRGRSAIKQKKILLQVCEDLITYLEKRILNNIFSVIK